MEQQDRHYVRAGSHKMCLSETPNVEEHREHIEPWLSALCQSDHLSLLVGSGLTTAIATAAGASQVNMGLADLEDVEHAHSVNAAAKESARRIGRGEPNLEDQLRAIGQLVGGLEVLAANSSADNHDNIVRLRAVWEAKQERVLSSLIADVLSTEQGIDQTLTGSESTAEAHRVRRYLGGFLLPFASRTVTRERLHIFTTNYDRLIEYGCDLLGLRIIDRFVGSLTPVFRATRLGVDMLTIPSAHLVIISYGSLGQRLQSFLDRAARDAQITLLVGPHFGDLETLVDNYLPKPAIDKTTWRMVEMLNRRRRPVEAPTERVAGSTSADEGAK